MFVQAVVLHQEKMNKNFKVNKQHKEMTENVKAKPPVKKQKSTQNDMSDLNQPKTCKSAIHSDERFYKIMFTDANWHKMKFPPLFVKLFEKDITSSATATLVVPSGQSWTTSISYSETHVYLKRGFEEFLKDNLVKEYEILTFDYVGNMRFLVRVFDISGLEKMSINIHDTKKLNPVIKKKYNRVKCKKNSCSGKKEQKKVKKETDTEDEIILPATTPYFTIKIDEGYAIVPDTFAEKYLKGKNVKGKLVVGGWTDLVEFRNENDRWVIGCGWNEFIRGNKLKLMDSCVFELVDEKKLTFKVSFGRSNV